MQRARVPTWLQMAGRVPAERYAAHRPPHGGAAASRHGAVRRPAVDGSGGRAAALRRGAVDRAAAGPAGDTRGVGSAGVGGRVGRRLDGGHPSLPHGGLSPRARGCPGARGGEHGQVQAVPSLWRPSPHLHTAGVGGGLTGWPGHGVVFLVGAGGGEPPGGPVRVSDRCVPEFAEVKCAESFGRGCEFFSDGGGSTGGSAAGGSHFALRG